MGFMRTIYVVQAIVLLASVIMVFRFQGAVLRLFGPPHPGAAHIANASASRADGSEDASSAGTKRTTATSADGPRPTALRVKNNKLARRKRSTSEPKDDSHSGMVPDGDGIHHAWAEDQYKVGRDGEPPVACHGATINTSCVSSDAQQWFEQHVLLGIVTGREGIFRVEVSYCTWLKHFAPSNVHIFTDVAPKKPQTPHRYVECTLPEEIEERDGDLFSQHLKRGYVREVRRAGQGYSVGWIIAQIRFLTALGLLAKETAKRNEIGGADIRWVMLVDDDTIVNLNYLVQRVRQMDARRPWYLSRKGWGGAGHLYSVAAMSRISERIHECLDKWMIRKFHASDTTLVKCANHLKLDSHTEHSMSHCPASNVRERLLNVDLMTVHGKKDYYPPVILTTWRTALYYHAFYCKNPRAAKMAIFFSSCAYGNCRRSGCTKEQDKHRSEVWLQLSRNNTIERLDFSEIL